MEILIMFFKALFETIDPVVLILIAAAMIVSIIIVWKNIKDYKQGAYYKVTGNSYISVRFDVGRYGEYLIYKHLKKMEAKGAKFLFNVYIPKGDDETTEVDVMVICSKGILVFESKNYSGWIFGSEHQKNWYQTLPTGRGKSRKENFYNPVMQNRTHIKHLRAFLGDHIPMWSIIVFSDRCTLKNIQIKDEDVSVINRYNVARVVSDIYNKYSTDIMDEKGINEIYDKLYPFTQVSEALKAKHVQNIKNNINSVSEREQNNQTDHEKISASALNEQDKVESDPNEEFDIGFQSHDNSNVDIDSMSTNDKKIFFDERNDEGSNEKEVVETSEQNDVEFDNSNVNETTFKCPRCGSELILRTASKGSKIGEKFYGCSKFPKCRYIQNVSNEE